MTAPDQLPQGAGQKVKETFVQLLYFLWHSDTSAIFVLRIPSTRTFDTRDPRSLRSLSNAGRSSILGNWDFLRSVSLDFERSFGEKSQDCTGCHWFGASSVFTFNYHLRGTARSCDTWTLAIAEFVRCLGETTMSIILDIVFITPDWIASSIKPLYRLLHVLSWDAFQLPLPSAGTVWEPFLSPVFSGDIFLAAFV